MTIRPAPSTATSMAYSFRTKLGFDILLWLVERGRVGEAQVPDDAVTMIRTWANMKKGRKRGPSLFVKSQLVALLDDVPAANSSVICNDLIAKRMVETGQQLIIDGYVVTYPVSLSDSWSYRRTALGDQLLRDTRYNLE